MVKFIETGNNGKRFDYDICLTDQCWGDSNTFQKLIYDRIGFTFKIPKGIRLPGIEGRVYKASSS